MSAPIALAATQHTDARWTVTVTWPEGYETNDLADCPTMAFAAGRREGVTEDEALLWADLDAGIAVVDATTATISIAAGAWPDDCPGLLRWGIVVVDEQGRVAQVAHGSLRVVARTPSGEL